MITLFKNLWEFQVLVCSKTRKELERQDDNWVRNSCFIFGKHTEEQRKTLFYKYRNLTVIDKSFTIEQRALQEVEERNLLFAF